MRDKGWGVVLVFGLLAGCAENSRGGAMQSPQSGERDAAASGKACDDDYQARADELRAGAESCEQDEDCAVIGIDAPCLLAFLCPTPLNRMADSDGLRSEASRLSAAYRDCSDSCAVANCVYGVGAPAMCNPSTHRCQGAPFR
jgi:hypothetical protein